jgi:outer membrane autotransporter protein
LVKLEPVKYSKTDVKIVLSTDASKIETKRAGLTANQNATLDGVISVAGKNASADAALLSTDTGGALNQLSGELHASTQSALLNSSSLLTTTIAKRMRGNVGAGMMAGAPVAQSSGSMPAGAMPSSAAYPLWAQVVGNWSSLDGNNNAAKVKSDTAGLFIGGDVGVGQGWRLGATLGFTDGKIKVDDRSSRSDVRSYTAAIYGGNSWATAKGSVNFLAGAGYTRHDVDSRRTVTIGGNQTLKADYKANTTHLFTELGYAMPVGKASVVEPYLGLAWISQRAKGFDESGGSAALRGQSQTDNVTTFTLGARGKTTVEAGRHEVRLSAGAGWRHAAGDVDASRKMSFIQGNGATFQVAGAPIAKNAAVVDLGAEMTVGKNAAMGLSYNGQFGNGNTDSTGSLYLKVRFK